MLSRWKPVCWSRANEWPWTARACVTRARPVRNHRPGTGAEPGPRLTPLVLAPQVVEDRSHEITAMPPWRQVLALAGCMVTLDRGSHGWGGQKVIAPPICAQGAHYALTIKEHPKHWPDRLEDTLTYEPSQDLTDGPHDDIATVGQDPGRLETRRCGVIGVLAYGPYVDPEPVWTDRQSRVRVASERRGGRPVTGRNHGSSE